jgi:hypothetical protein
MVTISSIQPIYREKGKEKRATTNNLIDELKRKKEAINRFIETGPTPLKGTLHLPILINKDDNSSLMTETLAKSI